MKKKKGFYSSCFKTTPGSVRLHILVFVEIQATVHHQFELCGIQMRANAF